MEEKLGTLPHRSIVHQVHHSFQRAGHKDREMPFPLKLEQKWYHTTVMEPPVSGARHALTTSVLHRSRARACLHKVASLKTFYV